MSAQAAGSILQELDLPEGTRQPGGTVAILQNGTVAAQRCFGAADIAAARTVTPDTLFDIASTSKQVTALIIHLLADGGRLGLDDSVASHLPELSALPSGVTLRRLMHHLGGLHDYGELRELAGHDDHEIYGHADILALLARQSRLMAQPGTEWNYNNSGYVLLAEVAARVAGMPFHRVAREMVFTPLGMHRSTFVSPDADRLTGRAIGYERALDGHRPAPGGHLHVVGDGGMLTAMADLARLDLALSQPGLLPERVHQAMVETVSISHQTFYPSYRYASGLFVGTYAGHKTVFHGGNYAGFRSEFMRFPDNGFAIAVMLNEAERDPLAIATAIADKLLGCRGGGIALDRYWHRVRGPVWNWPFVPVGRYHCPDLGVTLRIKGRGTIYDVIVEENGRLLTDPDRGGPVRLGREGLFNGRLRILPLPEGQRRLGVSISLDRTGDIHGYRL